jgi:hypothetical protein
MWRASLLTIGGDAKRNFNKLLLLILFHPFLRERRKVFKEESKKCLKISFKPIFRKNLKVKNCMPKIYFIFDKKNQALTF